MRGLVNHVSGRREEEGKECYTVLRNEFTKKRGVVVVRRQLMPAAEIR